MPMSLPFCQVLPPSGERQNPIPPTSPPPGATT